MKAVNQDSFDVNSHIHTTYSFSPYTPAQAIIKSVEAGLATSGIMDHDSAWGHQEFIDAGAKYGMPVTIGVEVRFSFADTPLIGRKFNNPDQASIAYMTLHGIPHSQIEAVKAFMRPYMDLRYKRDERMVDNINALMKPYGISLDMKTDVVPISNWEKGGTITERHLMYALALKIVERFGKGEAVVRFLSEDMGIVLSQSAVTKLLDTEFPYYEYDLLGVLKSDMIGKVYVDATDECPPVAEAVRFSQEHGIALTYPYLGDIGESITGDKRAQKCEDEYLDQLFEVITDLGIKGVSYMPSRNTHEQLTRLRALCAKYNMLEISGEDINQPRQGFVCMKQREPEFANLYDAAWALIGHELLATEDLDNAIFSPKMIEKMPKITDRIEYFKRYALDYYGRKS